MTIRSILCAVDLSPVSTPILRAALAMAKREGARVTVFHALEPLLAQASVMTYTTDVLTKMALDDLDALIHTLAPEGPEGKVPVAPAVGAGETHEAILAAADAYDADLIVMGRHGFTGIRKLFFGSTAAHVLAASRVPVLALPSQMIPAGTAPEGLPLGLHRLLAAVDFSESSMRAIEVAADLARRWKLPLLLVHAEPPAPPLERWSELLDEHHERRLQRARHELELIARDIEGVVVTASTVGGRPEEIIAQTVDERPGTLLILGGGVGRTPHAFTPGSTTYKLMCLSQAPVLMIPGHVTTTQHRAGHAVANKRVTKRASTPSKEPSVRAS